VRLAAARAWSVWEGSALKLIPDQALIDDFSEPHKALALARIEAHYFRNGAFLETDNYLLDNVDKISHIPAVIVQGRYDVICPMMSAWALHRAWPEAEFIVVADAGHSVTDPGIRSALLEATDRFRNQSP
jgi:proline iminopeptidase